MLVVRRIRVTYHLRVAPGADRATIDRVHGFHRDRCPVARTIGACVDISTELVLHHAREAGPAPGSGGAGG